jgi:hypothetical protein
MSLQRSDYCSNGVIESPGWGTDADVAELVDARDLKSRGPGPCGFESHRRYQESVRGGQCRNRSFSRRIARIVPSWRRTIPAAAKNRSILAGQWSTGTEMRCCRRAGASAGLSGSNRSTNTFDQLASTMVSSGSCSDGVPRCISMFLERPSSTWTESFAPAIPSRRGRSSLSGSEGRSSGGTNPSRKTYG